MDVNQVLANTISPDDATRTNAENQLLQAASADFSGYLITLAQALANEQAPPHIRTAAGIALKNAFSFRDFTRLREVQNRWIQQITANVKKEVKSLALQTLKSSDGRAGQSAGQFIASIAAIELPRNEWPELMPSLVENVGSGSDHHKQASLVTIGFICETEDIQLRQSLSAYSNAILTAVVQGARKEETNNEVRNAAITALSDCLEFVRSNFDNEGERNYIMQVVCEATQAEDSRIQAGSFGCLNRIMGLYYDKMKFYMEKALYGLTIIGMRNEEEDVAKLAVEFWCTVCEEEIGIDDDNVGVDAAEARVSYHFSRVAAHEVVPTLLFLLTKQDEDAGDDDYNISRAAYQCLQLFATSIGSEIVGLVLGFVEQNLRDADWRKRDAAVSAFSAILDGPEEKILDPLVKQALPLLLSQMMDDNVHVRDSAAYALGRICDLVPGAIDTETQLPSLIEALFQGLSLHARMATSCCWALISLADNFSGEPGSEHNELSNHFKPSVAAILSVTEKPDANSQLRIAAYEVLNNFVTNAAMDVLPLVANLSDVILGRLEGTIPMQQQIVSIEDKMILEEIQTSLSSVLMAIIQRLEGEIRPQADRIMDILLRILTVAGPKSSVPDAVFAAIGALANAIEEDMSKYMEAFVPFLVRALANQEEPAVCSMAIGLVSDITRSIGDKIQPYCDSFMNLLLENLRSTALSNQFKPAILQCFGDIAQAIGVAFETYLSVVAQILQQAANVNVGPENVFDMVEYVISLREGIMDAWSGIILAMRNGKVDLLRPYIEAIFQLLGIVAQDENRTEGLLRSSMGVIGDLADAFSSGEFASQFRQEWVAALIKDTRLNPEFSQRTRDTARWAKEQVRRQPQT